MRCACKFCMLCFAAMLLTACEREQAPQEDRAPANNSINVARAERVPLRETDPRPSRQGDIERRARLTDLEQQLQQVRAQRDALMLQRDALAVRVEAQQSEDSAMLAQIRTELSARRMSGGGTPGLNDQTAQRFESDARSRIERALASDEKMRSDLDALNAQDAELQSHIAAISGEIAALKTDPP